MKVVLFCGGMGMRLKEHPENTPKPLVNIGYRPILWYVMNYYAHYGHKEFILCLGYKADLIKDYFLNYNECLSNNFTLSEGGQKLELLTRDIYDWKITFVDTGLNANVGQRLLAVKDYLKGEELFLANYTDGLTDLPLPKQIDHFAKHGKMASFLCVKPNLTCHFVHMRANGLVHQIKDIHNSSTRINGGFFIFKQEIFNYIRTGEELVCEPFQRLIDEKQLIAYRHDGFWACMDTFKDRQMLEDLHAKGRAPWEAWKLHRTYEHQQLVRRNRKSVIPLVA